MFPRHVQVLKALILSEFLAVLRARSIWAVSAGGLLVGFSVLLGRPPLQEPAAFVTSTHDGMAHLVTFLLAATVMLTASNRSNSPSWPITPELQLFARGCGSLGAMTFLLAILILVQHVSTGFLPEHEHAHVPLAAPLTRLWSSALFGLLLSAWGSFLVILLRPTTALLAFIVIFLAGFTLPQLQHLHPTMGVLLGVLPDLRSVAPISGSLEAPTQPWRAGAYCLAHAATILVLAALTLRTRVGSRRHIDSRHAQA